MLCLSGTERSEVVRESEVKFSTSDPQSHGHTLSWEAMGQGPGAQVSCLEHKSLVLESHLKSTSLGFVPQFIHPVKPVLPCPKPLRASLKCAWC